MNGHPKDTGNMGHRQHGTQDTEEEKTKKKHELYNLMKHYITGIYCTNVHSNLK